MTLLQRNGTFQGVDLNNTLQQANRSMGEAVSGLDKQLVNPFKSITDGIQSGVALVSEKESQLLSNISSYKSAAIDGINNSLKNLTGGLFNIGDIGSIITYQDGFKVDTNQLLRLGSKGLGFNINSMMDLKQEIGDGFLKELDSMTFGLASSVFRADGTKISLADDWKFGVGNSIIDFLGKDDPEGFGTVVNVAAMNSILNTMINQTVTTGMWQGYGNYGNMYIFESDYHGALIDSLSIAIGRGDAKSIQTILDIIAEEGVLKVNAKYPDLIEQMLGNFTFGNDVTADQYPELTALLLKVCVTVAGPNWYKYPTQFGDAYKLSLVGFISEDAKTLLNEEEPLIPLLCSSGIFVEQRAQDVFLSDFPKAVVFDKTTT
ncbi:putative virion structural protein [Pseudomonas phage OBP]|uniref:putative virion structural protein n=1 Tax=Pseudomonas phage OBP TaxID=1124849 RepID=UPI000240D5FB|nr:putative virion structural protein [Pseudomonas phage OBP]AEV89711.1 putative virion structural protein [Pseudomonas phage OBP]